MIKAIQFTKRMACDRSVADQFTEFCNNNFVTKDKIIDIEYISGTCGASILLVYEEYGNKKSDAY